MLDSLWSPGEDQPGSRKTRNASAPQAGYRKAGQPAPQVGPWARAGSLCLSIHPRLACVPATGPLPVGAPSPQTGPAIDPSPSRTVTAAHAVSPHPLNPEPPGRGTAEEGRECLCLILWDPTGCISSEIQTRVRRHQDEE